MQVTGSAMEGDAEIKTQRHDAKDEYDAKDELKGEKEEPKLEYDVKPKLKGEKDEDNFSEELGEVKLKDDMDEGELKG